MRARHLRYMRALLAFILILPMVSIALQPESGTFSESIGQQTPSESSTFTNGGKANVSDIFDITYPNDVVSLADTPGTLLPASGTLDPVQVEQFGYSMTGIISARTDTMTNTEQSITIDTEHDWAVSTTQVEVTNLEKLYVVNGSFDEGNLGYTVNPNGTLTNYPYGWSAVSNNTDPEQAQQVSYEDSSGNRFVSVQNIGPETNTGQNLYTHYNGSYVLWNQTIAITPYTEQFLLSFDFLYLKGPIWSELQGNFSLQVFVDGESVWRQDLPTLSERGIWYDSGIIPVNMSISSEKTMFMIGLVIDDTFSVDADLDYDDADDIPDGIINCQYITVLLDDVSFKGATPPSCETVDLQFILDSVSTPIFGSLGTGYGAIENPIYWQTSPLSFSIVSNTSISLEYNTLLLNHRYLNSTPTTNTLQEGVAYSIAHDQSGNLEMFTYLGFIGAYENLTIRIYHPSDWQNFTVFDPFLVDITSDCTLTEGEIVIPNQLLDRFGWWRITCDAPNYASSSVVERYDSGATDWVNDSIFHSNDTARLSVSLGTTTDTPLLSDPVNFTWTLPNCTTWYESSMTGGVDGNTSSSQVTFGPTNTTAGVWGITCLWSNGSELAYRYAVFALHHTAVLVSVYSNTLETVVGQPVSVFLTFRDDENGLYILNDGATVVGNWSGSDVDFVPDVVKNWWQADFDTALVGAGVFTVSIVSAAPYFETVPLMITIKSQFLTTLDPPSGPLTPLVYGRQYSYDFFYSTSYNGTGIDEADVDVTEDGSEWALIVNTGNGYYNLTITPMATGDFSIRIEFSKEGYETESHVLSFLVNRVPVEVESISNLVALEQTPLDVYVHIVESDTRHPVTGANVTLGVYRPGGVIYFYSEMEEIGAGNYSVIILMPPSESGTYTVRISIEKDNHEMTQSFSAALVPTFDSNIKIMETLLTYSWQIGIGVTIIVAAVAGQRIRSRKIRDKHTSAMVLKNRFSDANNILGFLVLHKLSGVPVYSKIFKGGFEEGMLSAFISAIMHFRSEFEAGRVADDYAIIPISEVIRTVPTENLVCAFITVTPASVEQETRMKSYARAIGMMFDNALAERIERVIDAKTSKTFEWMFDDFMDGNLIRRYQIGEKKFPKPLKFIETAIPLEVKDSSFNLARLVRLLESSGQSEDDVYIRVFKAIEGEYILPVYPYSNDVPLETE
ncbi:MAG: hypothetical protein KGD60_09910 [Candidatus Thorarchaeota archaeon]|nr:hypothetical protein [Candidatus Thorarchaeota archaeon]